MEKNAWITILLSVSMGLLLIFLLSTGAGAAPVRPEGTLVAALPTLAEEGYLPDRCSNTTSPLWESVYSYLIYSDSLTQKPIPGVAERWDYSKDYRSLTFRLRKGIQFHDGWGELTAEDVKWTIEFNARPASLNLRSTELKKIKSIDVVDRYTLVIHLKEPDPIFWLLFCTGDNTSLPILCKKYIETVGEDKANRQPIGTGPYRLVEQRVGDSAKFEAVDSHWMVVPEFKYLVLRIVPEETTRLAMLMTGEIDISTELSIDKMPDLEKAGLKTILSKNSTANFLAFGGMLLPEDKRYVEGYHRKDPWNDVRVREAMNIAIDRNALTKSLYRGTATIAPIWTTIKGWDQLEPIPYDAKRAKQLLAQAGYPNGFSFKIYSHNKQPLLLTLAEAVAGYWDAIGLKAEITPGDYATWRTTAKSGKTAGWLWTQLMNDYADWSTRLPSYELPGASTPLWQSEETKKAIIKALAEFDPQKKEAYFKELSRVYRTLYSHVPIVFAPRVHGAGKKVGEWSPTRLDHPKNFVFARHAKPLNTFRLFTP